MKLVLPIYWRFSIMGLLNMSFLVAVIYKVDGMASLGNGSLKKISVRTKVARFCQHNPGVCDFKVAMLHDRRKNPSETSKGTQPKYENFETEEIYQELGENVGRPNIKTKKHMGEAQSCYFAVQAKVMVAKAADAITNAVNPQRKEIVQAIKTLVEDLLTLPQAIIICIPTRLAGQQNTEYKHAPVNLNLQNILNKAFGKESGNGEAPVKVNEESEIEGFVESGNDVRHRSVLEHIKDAQLSKDHSDAQLSKDQVDAQFSNYQVGAQFSKDQVDAQLSRDETSAQLSKDHSDAQFSKDQIGTQLSKDQIGTQLRKATLWRKRHINKDTRSSKYQESNEWSNEKADGKHDIALSTRRSNLNKRQNRKPTHASINPQNLPWGDRKKKHADASNEFDLDEREVIELLDRILKGTSK